MFQVRENTDVQSVWIQHQENILELSHENIQCVLRKGVKHLKYKTEVQETQNYSSTLLQIPCMILDKSNCSSLFSVPIKIKQYQSDAIILKISLFSCQQFEDPGLHSLAHDFKSIQQRYKYKHPVITKKVWCSNINRNKGKVPRTKSYFHEFAY